MTYGELKNRVLELIFSYSVAGSQIPVTYNNQADYITMIPGLVNNGQMDIATSVKRIPAIVLLADLEQEQVGERILYAVIGKFAFDIVGGPFAVFTALDHHTVDDAEEFGAIIVAFGDELFKVCYRDWSAVVSQFDHNISGVTVAVLIGVRNVERHAVKVFVACVGCGGGIGVASGSAFVALSGVAVFCFIGQKRENQSSD